MKNTAINRVINIVIAIIAGMGLNMVIIMLSNEVVPPPEGADLKTMEGLKAAMPLMQPIHFLMPFLAHALGTMLAAFIIVSRVDAYHQKYAIGTGLFFLTAGAINVYVLPAPFWFNVVDLIGAYIPMAFIGYVLARKLNKK
jgi:hypothetical protein